MMGNPLQKPSILIVDDEPELVQSEFALLADDVDVDLIGILHPEDLESDQLQEANLILVDYRLKHWSERDFHSSVAMRPETGLSLAAILRE